MSNDQSHKKTKPDEGLPFTVPSNTADGLEQTQPSMESSGKVEAVCGAQAAAAAKGETIDNVFAPVKFAKQVAVGGENLSATETAAAVTAKPQNGVQNFFHKVGQLRFFAWCKRKWGTFKVKHKTFAQFLVFFVLSNGITLLQMALMPLFKLIFNATSLVDINFQIGQIGKNFNGTPYFMFDYGAGMQPAGGGGLAYFLAMQITMAIAQIINFFAQRKVTFKSNNNIWRAAMWYVLAYVVITVVAAALQGLYKAPVYNLFMNVWKMGDFGGVLADFVVMIINCAISFWVFFPIFKIIFKQKKEAEKKAI